MHRKPRNAQVGPALGRAGSRFVGVLRRGLAAGAARAPKMSGQNGRFVFGRVLEVARGIHIPLALVIALGLAISASGYFVIEHLFRARAQSEFEGPASRYASAVSQSLDRYLELTKSMGAFFGASNEVDRWEFFEFARDTLPRYRALQAIEWIPRVPSDARSAFERQAQDDGLFGFHFSELDLLGERMTAAARDTHYPVYFVEPFEGNERDLGRDLAANRLLLRDLMNARDRGQMIVSGRQGAPLSEGQPELVVVQPVYRSGKVPESLAERRAELLGFARGVVRLGDAVQTAVPARSQPINLDVYLFDRESDGSSHLVYFKPAPIAQDDPMPLSELEALEGPALTVDLTLAGRNWTILIRPAESARSADSAIAAWAVFTIGLLLTAMLSQYLIASRSRTRAIERAVKERTAELRETNQALELEIKERRRIEGELRSAKERAEVANRVKSEFLAVMGHELRTPLNAVIGFADILTKETFGPLGDKRYSDYAQDIMRSGENLLGTINHILDLTRIESGEYTLREEPMPPARLLEIVDIKVGPSIREAQLRYQQTLADDLPPLTCDSNAIQQVLLDLLSNAVKFTPQGGLVKVSVEPNSDGGLEFSVSDSGIGIAAEQLSHILEPFTQADQSLARRYEGAGLGLPLAAKLMKLHEGRLEIDSRVGEGTTVTMIFPAARCGRPKIGSRVA